jgi:ribosome modulation factor
MGSFVKLCNWYGEIDVALPRVGHASAALLALEPSMGEQSSSLGIGAMVADGYRAGRRGMSRSANPLDAGTAEAGAWDAGWREGAAVRCWIIAKEAGGGAS